MKTYDYYLNELKYQPEPSVDTAALEVLANLTHRERESILDGKPTLPYPKYLSLSIDERQLALSRITRAIQRVPFSPIHGEDKEWVWNPTGKFYINRRNNALRRYSDGSIKLHKARLHAYTDAGKICVADIYAETTLPHVIDRKYPVHLWFDDTTYTHAITKPTVPPSLPRKSSTYETFIHINHAHPTRFYIPVYRWNFERLDWEQTEYVSERHPNLYVDYNAIYYVPQGEGTLTLIGEWFAEDYACEVRAVLGRLHSK